MIIYKYLFRLRDSLSGCDAIVYSTLVGHSITSYGECYNADGAFDIETAKEIISENYDYHRKDYIEYNPISYSKLSADTGITKRNIIYIMNKLREKRYIIDDEIFCPMKLLDEGFIKLPQNTRLKGWQLIFYALLKERSIPYHGTIDTWAYRLAELFKTNDTNIYAYIKYLKDKGYIQRLKNGKIQVL